MLNIKTLKREMEGKIPPRAGRIIFRHAQPDEEKAAALVAEVKRVRATISIQTLLRGEAVARNEYSWYPWSQPPTAEDRSIVAWDYVIGPLLNALATHPLLWEHNLVRLRRSALGWGWDY